MRSPPCTARWRQSVSCTHPFEQAHRRTALRIITENENPREVLAHLRARTVELTENARARAYESLGRVLAATGGTALDHARRVHVGATEPRRTGLAVALHREPFFERRAHAIALYAYIECGNGARRRARAATSNVTRGFARWRRR